MRRHLSTRFAFAYERARCLPLKLWVKQAWKFIRGLWSLCHDYLDLDSADRLVALSPCRLVASVASVAFGVTYTALGLKANAHLNEKAPNSDRSVGWLFWWSFSKNKYNEEGKGLCAQGQMLALVLLALYATWYFVLLKK